MIECKARFTDYLNFFEFVAYLVESGQLQRNDAEALFDYYFACLRRHPRVRQYIDGPQNGYERLAAWIKVKEST